jgi:RNA polymerase sigma-70 factor (ECF subfamily)
MRRLGCAAKVGDIYQNLAEQTLTQPIKNLDNPKAYLFQSASNAVTDHYRKQTCRENYVKHVQSDNEYNVDFRSPEKSVAAAKTVEAIERALAKLPLLTQKIFYLYRLECLTQQAIADKLGISCSTVQRHLTTAIIHWKKSLNQLV